MALTHLPEGMADGCKIRRASVDPLAVENWYYQYVSLFRDI